MEELVVVVLKGVWGLIQAVYYLIRFIIQTIFFIRAKMPKKPEAYRLPEKARFEHTLIVGGSGHGKTQLLQHLFVCNDLNDVMAGRKSVVFIDSQGDMLQKILHLAELTPSRPQEMRQEPPQPARQERKQPVRQEVTENSAKALLKRTTALGHLWHGCLVFLLLMAVIIVGGAVAAFTKLEGLGIVVSIPLGFLTGAWLKRRKHPPTVLAASIGAAGFILFWLAVSPAVNTAIVVVLLLIVGVTFLGFVLIRKRPAEAPIAVAATTDVPAKAREEVPEKKRGGAGNTAKAPNARGQARPD